MFDRILLAVDGSEQSDKAVAIASDLARNSKGEILVFHVREKAAVRYGSFDVKLAEEDRNIADETAKSLKDGGIGARAERPSAYHGHTAKMIVEGAQSFDADVIVMGSRGNSDLAGIFLGSVAHKVLHLATCPVLVAR